MYFRVFALRKNLIIIIVILQKKRHLQGISKIASFSLIIRPGIFRYPLDHVFCDNKNTQLPYTSCSIFFFFLLRVFSLNDATNLWFFSCSTLYRYLLYRKTFINFFFLNIIMHQLNISKIFLLNCPRDNQYVNLSSDVNQLILLN